MISLIETARAGESSAALRTRSERILMVKCLVFSRVAAQLGIYRSMRGHPLQISASAKADVINVNITSGQ